MSNREDNPSEDEWSTMHRLGMSLAFGLFFASFLMGLRLTKVGSEGLSGSGSTVESIGVIAAGIFLFGVALV